MFSTAKEVHIYIDGALQVLSSNRKQSVAPELIDMFLNNSVIEYITSKFPSNFTNKDVESTLHRYTDFSVLKTKLSGIPSIETYGGRYAVKFIKPYNAIKVQAINCSYIRPYSTSIIEDDYKSSATITIDEKVFTEDDPTISISLELADGTTKNFIIELKKYLAEVRSEKGLFYLYNNLNDYLVNVCKLNVNYVSRDNSRIFNIEVPIGMYILNITSNSTYVTCTKSLSPVKVAKGVSTGVSSCSLHRSFDAKVDLSDFYRTKNMHKDPIMEIDEDSIVIYYTDFIPNYIDVFYLRKPSLFNIATGQIPEINITKDFLDYVVKDMHLILNSPAYDRVVNEIIKKS